jgi:hypothetical protein
MNRFSKKIVAIIVLGCLAGTFQAVATGAVVVLANRTTQAVRFEAGVRAAVGPARAGGDASRQTLTEGGLTLNLNFGDRGARRRDVIQSGECLAIEVGVSDRLSIRCDGVGMYELTPYHMYYLGPTRGGKVELQEIGLGGAHDANKPAAQQVVGAQADLDHPAKENPKAAEKRRTIQVAVYVDDEEPTVEHLWKQRLADRVAAASRILERACGMKVAVASYGRWESNDAVNDFSLSLREFEHNVHPPEGQLAIGFTNQYQITRGRTHLGGTRGPMHSHILLREWSQHVSEPERLELLVHELGHHLGASHSPESGSIMRPVLGDRQARRRDFRVAFDPLNALAMSLVGEEIRSRGITSFHQLSQPTKARLSAIYSTLAEAMPADPAAGAFLGYLRQ